VQVDKSAEALLRALEEPVDGPLLVDLEVILVKIGEEILLQRLAEGLLEEAQVFIEGVLAEGGSEEFAGAGDEVVFEPLAFENGDDSIRVRME